MLKDLVVVALTSKTCFFVLFQKLGNDVYNFVRVSDSVSAAIWENNARMLNFRHQYLSVAVKEWSDSDKHLVEEDTNSPPIDSHIVTSVIDHLWSQILGSTTVRGSNLTWLKHFSKTIVNNFDVSILVHHDILKFQVTMHDTLAVQLANSDDNLGCIEFHCIFWEALLFLENLIELSTIDKWHNEIEAGFRLEEVVHSTKEGMISFKEDLLFKSNAGNLVIFNEYIFSDRLDSILLVIVWQFGQIHFSKSAFAQLHDNVKIFQFYCCGVFISLAHQ